MGQNNPGTKIPGVIVDGSAAGYGSATPMVEEEEVDEDDESFDEEETDMQDTPGDAGWADMAVDYGDEEEDPEANSMNDAPAKNEIVNDEDFIVKRPKSYSNKAMQNAINFHWYQPRLASTY